MAFGRTAKGEQRARRERRRPRGRLPGSLRPFFWDYEFGSLSWERDRDLVTGRILSAGDWDAVTWLRRRVGDPGIREWILAHRGRGIDARRLRFWELVLALPRRSVNAWLGGRERRVWDRRVRPGVLPRRRAR